MPLIGQIVLNFVLAIPTGLIGIALWEGPIKRLRAWVKARPSPPMSLENKVKLAQQITQTEAYIQALDQVKAHPTELFLRLFRYLLGIVFLFMLAAVLFALRGFMNNEVAGALFCLMFIPVFGALALYESFALSETRITATRAKAQKSLDEAKAQLATHAIGVLPMPPLTAGVAELIASPQSRDETGNSASADR